MTFLPTEVKMKKYFSKYFTIKIFEYGSQEDMTANQQDGVKERIQQNFESRDQK